MSSHPVVYRIVERRTTAPLRTFSWIAAAVLVVQNLMHVVVAAVVLFELRAITSSDRWRHGSPGPVAGDRVGA